MSEKKLATRLIDIFDSISTAHRAASFVSDALIQMRNVDYQSSSAAGAVLSENNRDLRKALDDMQQLINRMKTSGSEIDVPDDDRLKSFIISCGDSNEGQVGFVITVEATTAKEAVEIARQRVPDYHVVISEEDPVEYLHVHFGEPESITTADIKSWHYVHSLI